jgi:hypothetical protein
MKIKEVKDLSAHGFTLTPHGWSKEIPNTFRHTYTLYIAQDEGGADIYGTITGLASGGGDVLDYADFINRMAFRASAAAEATEQLLAALIAEGLVIVEREGDPHGC